MYICNCLLCYIIKYYIVTITIQRYFTDKYSISSSSSLESSISICPNSLLVISSEISWIIPCIFSGIFENNYFLLGTDSFICFCQSYLITVSRRISYTLSAVIRLFFLNFTCHTYIGSVTQSQFQLLGQICCFLYTTPNSNETCLENMVLS